MATGKVTKRSVDALLDASIAGFLWDDDLKGFGVRILSSSAASYIIQYRMGGREARTRRYTIGSHGSPWRRTVAQTCLSTGRQAVRKNMKYSSLLAWLEGSRFSADFCGFASHLRS
jgi:hypothetical protein